MVWALGLLGATLPAVLMLLLVRSLAERVEPGLRHRGRGARSASARS